MNIAIVGATGNVGRKIIEILEKKRITIENLYLLASKRSDGKKIHYNGKEYMHLNFCYLHKKKYYLLLLI